MRPLSTLFIAGKSNRRRKQAFQGGTGSVLLIQLTAALTLSNRVHEALRDPKTWLFALFSALNNVPNSLTNQSQIIVSSFGSTYLQTTLLGCVDGVIEIVTIWTGVHLAARLKDARACIGAVYFVPNLVGVLLIQLLPWSNRIGLLCGSWLTGTQIVALPSAKACFKPSGRMVAFVHSLKAWVQLGLCCPCRGCRM